MVERRLVCTGRVPIRSVALVPEGRYHPFPAYNYYSYAHYYINDEDQAIDPDHKKK
jgi:5-deoxy-D-glucuronate isomerase